MIATNVIDGDIIITITIKNGFYALGDTDMYKTYIFDVY